MKRALLSYEDLCFYTNKQVLYTNNSKRKNKSLNFLGQEKALEVLDFGLLVSAKGYNIYISGEMETHKEQNIIKYIENYAKKQPVPNDWCYVYNFNNELKPIAISLPAGMGKCFKKDIKNTINKSIQTINHYVESDEYLEKSNKIKDSYYEEGEKLLKHIKERAKELGFYTQISETGLYFVPILDGKKISEQVYDDLSVDEQEKILANLNMLEDESEHIMKKIKELKKEAEEQKKVFEDKTIKEMIEKNFLLLIEKYSKYDKVFDYLKRLKKELVLQINEIIQKDDNKDSIKTLISSMTKEEDTIPNKFDVNLLVDNSDTIGAPVVYNGNPNFNNIVGRVEYENELGNLTTDFTKIQPGLLHLANGGYLILHVNDVIRSPYVWEFINKSINNEQIELENIREKLGGVPLRSVNPEPVPLNVKVILIGSQHLYQLMYYYEEEFKKCFKVHVQLDYEMNRNDKTITEYSDYIDNFLEEKNLLPIKIKAKLRIINYASRLVGSRDKLSTKVRIIEDLLIESNYWAKSEEDIAIYDYHVKKALSEKDKRNYLIRDKFLNMMKNEKIKIKVQGKSIGEINGLAVINYGDSSFGKPTRITATTYMGKSGMVNIEKEAGLSGSIHNKGVNILSGFLGQKYAQEYPLTLSCRICFEQNYSDIDGDSASSTELYAILSSLSETPLKQNLAVTGSVDQRGNIQPVGGIIEKIEGFYYVCKNTNFTGQQGVIIPRTNIDEIVLNDEILQDIKQNKFFIYAIERVEEGIEILTGESCELIDEKIKEKLNKYYKNSKLNN